MRTILLTLSPLSLISLPQPCFSHGPVPPPRRPRTECLPEPFAVLHLELWRHGQSRGHEGAPRARLPDAQGELPRQLRAVRLALWGARSPRARGVHSAVLLGRLRGPNWPSESAPGARDFPVPAAAGGLPPGLWRHGLVRSDFGRSHVEFVRAAAATLSVGLWRDFVSTGA